jgi:hypothetical protein
MENELKTRLAEVQEELISISIKYHNMRDRLSFKTLGITSGIALAFIGITLGRDWVMRIAFLLAAALLILGAIYGIKKIDRGELEDLSNQVSLKKDQVNDLKKAIRQQQMEQRKK